MKVTELLDQWQHQASARRAARDFTVRLPVHDAARVLALAAMYPGRTETQLIAELLSAALDEVEATLPYVQGARPVAEDEQGDPIYEDAGPTPRFLELARYYAHVLAQEIA